MPRISAGEFDPCRCEFTTFLPACRFMTCGPPICRGRGPESHWMNFLRTASASVHALADRARAPADPFLRRTAPGLGLGTGRNRVGKLRHLSDSLRYLEVTCAGGHARGTLPSRVPLRKRAAS
jgi:hypothetical protein